jgi:hypothetical protein
MGEARTLTSDRGNLTKMSEIFKKLIQDWLDISFVICKAIKTVLNLENKFKFDSNDTK